MLDNFSSGRRDKVNLKEVWDPRNVDSTVTVGSQSGRTKKETKSPNETGNPSQEWHRDTQDNYVTFLGSDKTPEAKYKKQATSLPPDLGTGERSRVSHALQILHVSSIKLVNNCTSQVTRFREKEKCLQISRKAGNIRMPSPSNSCRLQSHSGHPLPLLGQDYSLEMGVKEGTWRDWRRPKGFTKSIAALPAWWNILGEQNRCQRTLVWGRADLEVL